MAEERTKQMMLDKLLRSMATFRAARVAAGEAEERVGAAALQIEAVLEEAGLEARVSADRVLEEDEEEATGSGDDSEESAAWLTLSTCPTGIEGRCAGSRRGAWLEKAAGYRL